MKQQACVATTRGVIGREQGFYPHAEVGYRGIGVAQRTRRTHGRARPAPHAKMRLDPDMIAIGGDGGGRADVDALVATGLLRAAMRADARLVIEETGLLELADGLRYLRDGACLRKRIGTGSPVPLRRLMHPEIRLALQVEYQVEMFRARSVATIEVDCGHGAAGNDALAMIPATIEIDLIAPIDGGFRTNFDACVAARA